MECVIDCGHHSDDNGFFAQMHKEFIEAIEKNLQIQKGAKKKTKRHKKWVAERILGSVMSQGELMFMTKWKNKDDVAFVSAQQAKLKFPELVIKYFEKRLKWHPIHENQLKH